MDIKKITLEALVEITGLPLEDLADNMSLRLRDEGILDSLSCAALATELQERIGRKFKSSKMVITDFETIDSIIEAVKRNMK